MDLRRYFQPVRGDALPDPKGPLSATIPQQAIVEANKQVQEAEIAKASKKRGSYGRFDTKTRAAIGKYSCENVVAAARYYSKALHRPVNDSTVCYIKKAYLEEQSRKRRAENDTAVASFPTKKTAQSCLHSPLPRSRVFTSHCRAVVSSLATAAQSCLHLPLPRSCVFTRHCQWSTETLQCLRNSLARDTMSTMYIAATKRGHILPTEVLHVYW